MIAYANREDAIKGAAEWIMEDSYDAYTELDLPKIEKDLRRELGFHCYDYWVDPIELDFGDDKTPEPIEIQHI